MSEPITLTDGERRKLADYCRQEARRHADVAEQTKKLHAGFSLGLVGKSESKAAAFTLVAAEVGHDTDLMAAAPNMTAPTASHHERQLYGLTDGDTCDTCLIAGRPCGGHAPTCVFMGCFACKDQTWTYDKDRWEQAVAALKAKTETGQ